MKDYGPSPSWRLQVSPRGVVIAPYGPWGPVIVTLVMTLSTLTVVIITAPPNLRLLVAVISSISGAAVCAIIAYLEVAEHRGGPLLVFDRKSGSIDLPRDRKRFESAAVVELHISEHTIYMSSAILRVYRLEIVLRVGTNIERVELFSNSVHSYIAKMAGALAKELCSVVVDERA